MNLSKLFKIQKQLDDRIVKEKGLEGQDLLDKKILALQVELGELANEWRGFKFWSEDQEPRTEVPDFETWKKNGHKTYKGKPAMHFKNPLLEEYVDCLHFFLSIGINSNVRTDIDFDKAGTRDIMTLFAKINRYTAEMWWEHNGKTGQLLVKWLFGFQNFLRLGEMLGFTWDEIEKAYLEKNKINHERQESGY